MRENGTRYWVGAPATAMESIWMTRIARATSMTPAAVAGGRLPSRRWACTAMRRASSMERSADVIGRSRLAGGLKHRSNGGFAAAAAEISSTPQRDRRGRFFSGAMAALALDLGRGRSILMAVSVPLEEDARSELVVCPQEE